jgi:hypothetical protein
MVIESPASGNAGKMLKVDEEACIPPLVSAETDNGIIVRANNTTTSVDFNSFAM